MGQRATVWGIKMQYLPQRNFRIHQISIFVAFLVDLFYHVFLGSVEEGTVLCQRRSCLPSPSPNNSTISLWNILRNNIGKDLSKVAMPVQLNEPLNTLQRLCEELEYSELLDRAANTQDPFERMVRWQIYSYSLSVWAESFLGFFAQITSILSS